MTTFAAAHASIRRQRGAASIAIAMLLLFILAAAVVAVMEMSGSSVVDAAKHEEQVAALFLAESGVERAQATINAAALAGAYTDTTCTGIASGTPQSLGRGSFTYTSATSSPSPCGGSNPACNNCVITVRGAIGTSNPSSRTLRASVTSTQTDGAAGCGSNFSLDMPIAAGLGQAAVFTNISWRAKGIGGVCSGGSSANASVDSCINTNPGGNCLLGTNGWILERTGTTNASSVGVYASAPTPGNYTLAFTLAAPPGATPTTRSYSATGVVFYPFAATGTVGFVGSYGVDNKTADTADLDGVVPDTWTCSPGNGNLNDMSRAAGADTLLYGLSALGQTTGNEATSIVFGIQPLYRVVSLVGGNTDYLYSQTWITYNPRYWPTAGATNGADFTGTIGATFTGSLTANGATLNVSSGGLTSGILALGDTITNTNAACPPAGVCGTVGTLLGGGGNWGQASSSYNFNKAPGIGNVSSSPMVAKSNTLQVVGNPASGVLTAGDSITNSLDTVTYGISLVGPTPCHTTTGPGPCAAAAGTTTYTFTGTALQLPSSSLHSAGTTITVPAGNPAPSVGTALALSSGAAAFGSASITGSISGTTLSVPSGPQPNVGDALYGRFVQPGTRITVALSATTYTVTPGQTASSGTILARAAVRGTDSGAPAPSATSFVVSQKPTPRLTSAQLCGGVCPLLYPFSGGGANHGTHFTITGLTSGRDWASGFACLNNVDSNNIRFLNRVIAQRDSWSEPVQ